MTSVRNKSSDASVADRLLDAARACIIDVGWKRTTLTDVANRAGVSRMTVYRTYSDMETLFAELLTREWTSVVEDVLVDRDNSAAWPDRIASGVSRSAAALRENELFRRAIDLDPEWLLPYLLQRRGRSQQAVLDLLTDFIRQAQAEHAVRAGEPDLIARTIVLAAHGHVVSMATMTDQTVSEAALDNELGDLLHRYLAP